MLANNSEYLEILNRLKEDIRSSRSRAAQSVNSELVCLYWRIGNVLNEHVEYGNRFIDSLAKDLRVEFPGIKGMNARNLRYMARFAREVDFEILQTVSAKLSWSHNIKLLESFSDMKRRLWYAHEAISQGWSLAVLNRQIDTDLYERQGTAGKATNFSQALPPAQSELAQQAFKDPYIFDFVTARQTAEERDIEQAMMDNLTNVLLELGTGFAFFGRQYHLVVGGDDFYIDMLFYNVHLHCYVVIELKNEPFKPEFNGQLGFYVAAVDGELCREGDNPTIGLLLCKTKNDVVAEYSLRSMDAPIGVSEYRLGDELPEAYAKVLPSPEDLLARI